MPHGQLVAVFDLEGTIVASNVIETYLWARLADLPRGDWAAELVDLDQDGVTVAVEGDGLHPLLVA